MSTMLYSVPLWPTVPAGDADRNFSFILSSVSGIQMRSMTRMRPSASLVADLGVFGALYSYASSVDLWGHSGLEGLL